MFKTILAAVAATIALSAPAHAGFLFKKQDNAIEVAFLESKNAKTGWLDVLNAAKPEKKAKKTIHTSPVARKLVSFDSAVAPGTIIVDNSERRLYHVIAPGLAMRYGISVGRDGFRWTGTEKVTAKTEWPSWNPPEEMRIREAKKGHILPVRMEGGIDNPLGARAMYLGSTEYRIHGTNQPASIGQAMSSGCIRMANEDVEHLYASVKIGATVVVRD